MKRIAIRHFMFDSTERKISPRMLAASAVQRMCKSFPYSTFDNTMTTKIFHPLLAMIASATDRELAKQVQYLKEENKILRARIPGQIVV
jgi:hypothetical protein